MDEPGSSEAVHCAHVAAVGGREGTTCFSISVWNASDAAGGVNFFGADQLGRWYCAAHRPSAARAAIYVEGRGLEIDSFALQKSNWRIASTAWGSAASVGKLKRRGAPLLFLFRSTPTASKSGLDWWPVHRVPARYLDTWARSSSALHRRAHPTGSRHRTLGGAALSVESRGLDDAARTAAAMRWTAGELFDVLRECGRPGGLVWQAVKGRAR